MRRGDWLILGLILFVAIGGLAYWQFRPWQADTGEIVIEVDGDERFSYPLSQQGRHDIIDVNGIIGITTVELGENRVRVSHSDCPDKVCVNMGWVDRPGRPIACLPNRVIVHVRGQQDDFDFITN
ncbi:MAG: NusG domain II-containing protein [Firmicutes bacterium]|nr:NusG domain II-containing protein [Bacillota bacterium]